MKESFEFLASFEDWEKACRSDARAMDRCPVEGAGTSFERSMAHAQLLNVLTSCSFPNQDPHKAAKNGRKKNDIVEVRGFPGLVNDKECGLSDTGWADWFFPGPEDLRLLPDGSCLLRIEICLRQPFFSRDDRVFYPTDNVLKRHHVFLTPYLATSGIKGLLRWAWSMSGEDEDAAGLLFGEAADGLEALSHQGLLRLWPLFWKGRVGLETINPQDRHLGTGTVPVKYEVVRPGATGALYLLLPNEENAVRRLLPGLVRSLFHLLDQGGLSARNTMGWGQVMFVNGSLYIKGCPVSSAAPSGKDKEAAKTAQTDTAALWGELLDGNGELLPYGSGKYTKKCCMSLLGITEKKWKLKQKDIDGLMADMAQALEAWRASQTAPDVPVAAPEPRAEWQVRSSIRSTFVNNVDTFVQEMDSWLK